MAPSFTIAEVSEFIARIFPRLPGDSSGFVTHHAIVRGIVEDPNSASLLRGATVTPATAKHMVAWFSQQITVGRSQWADFFDREKRDDVWAYRRITSVPAPLAEPDLLAAIEGEPRLFIHVRKERVAALAKAKREAVRRPDGQLACEVFGFLMADVYPGLTGDVCEVHHRMPLALLVEETPTRLEDLAVLCPNCHRAIHRTDPLLSVEDFRSRFFSSGRVSI